jgi:SSS family solute:Na+ symporter
MHLSYLDWLIIAVYLCATIGIGIYFSRRASGSIKDFFLAGRNLPWWLAGTSIVATTFAADTPLAVSGLIRSGGIYENWFWWNAAMGGMLSVFFYARLWRRAGILTDAEFIERRYSGKAAAILRGFMALYSGVIVICISMGWVMLAMIKISKAIFDWDRFTAFANSLYMDPTVMLLGILIVVALTYTMLSGLWGVVITDFIQFIIAMTGSVALAVIILGKLGGVSGMVESVKQSPEFTAAVFDFVPDLAKAGSLAVFTFIVYIAVQWWAGGPGGGSSVQRIMSAKNERHATLAVMWGYFNHYVVRPWPWIIVGLASFVYFSTGDLGNDPELAYPNMMVRFLPNGMRGLMIVSFIAAFMSTIDTGLNTGASYLVNDLYKRFISRHGSPHHYVIASRTATVIIICIGALIAWQMETIAGAWKYLAKMGSGVGLVLILRWFWWRINAWSEISALLTSLILANLLPLLAKLDGPLQSLNEFSVQLVIIVAVSTVVWVIVTKHTKPVDTERLKTFYRTVRPGGWWGPIARECPEVIQDRTSRGIVPWVTGCMWIYTSMFGLGYLCLGRYRTGVGFLIAAVLFGWMTVRGLFSLTPVSPEETNTNVQE